MILYSAAISACEKAGLWLAAIRLLRSMHAGRVSPNQVAWPQTSAGRWQPALPLWLLWLTVVIPVLVVSVFCFCLVIAAVLLAALVLTSNVDADIATNVVIGEIDGPLMVMAIACCDIAIALCLRLLLMFFYVFFPLCLCVAPVAARFCLPACESRRACCWSNLGLLHRGWCQKFGPTFKALDPVHFVPFLGFPRNQLPKGPVSYR